MKFVLICGDSAVGKMTVGQELAKITGFRLFHNHMAIEPVLDVFGYYNKKAVARIRDAIFEEFAATDMEGLIFTMMWAFDCPSDWDYVRHVTDIFEKRGAEIFYVELFAPQEVRLERNAGENRLENKPSKRNIETSNARLINDDIKFRCVSYDGEIPFENYMKIDNSGITAKEAAEMIENHFVL